VTGAEYAEASAAVQKAVASGADAATLDALDASRRDAAVAVEQAASSAQPSDGYDRAENFVAHAAAVVRLDKAEADATERKVRAVEARADATKKKGEHEKAFDAYQFSLSPVQVKVAPHAEPFNKVSAKRRGCARCRSGRETVEKSDREFTRKCGRDGKCATEQSLTIESTCAQGCHDHCLKSCRRYHDPKTRKCARARMHSKGKTGKASLAAALAPTQSLVELEEGVAGGGSAGMRGWLMTSAAQTRAAKVDIVEAQARKEVYILSDCMAECSRDCLVHCIGYGDPVNDSPLLVNKTATNATNVTRG